MGYRDAVRDAAADARRDVLEAALVLGVHLDAPEGDVDDETIVRALSAFMDARARYLAALGAQYSVNRDSGPRPLTRGTACGSSCVASARARDAVPTFAPARRWSMSA